MTPTSLKLFEFINETLKFRVGLSLYLTRLVLTVFLCFTPITNTN
jgi:hypothetical protein